MGIITGRSDQINETCMYKEMLMCRVILTKRSNSKRGYAIYGGTLSVIREDFVMLTGLRIINEHGGITAPKGRTRRKFKTEDIIKIVLEREEDETSN